MSAPTKVANLFQVHGHQLHVTYSTTSLDGKPQFTYQDPHQTLHFAGDEIESVASAAGAMVSVVIRRTIDSGSTSFTLLVPRVNLDRTDQVAIRTEGITTLHRFSIVPALNHGQLDLYTVHQLSGNASAVDF